MNDFNIKAVLRQTGLTAETLRAWERRYGAVHPKRSESGRRMYSSSDVHRLQLLASLTRNGFRIGDIAQLSDKELMRKLERCRNREVLSSPTEDSGSIGRLIDALDRFDFEGLRKLLTLARFQLSPREFTLELVPAIMYRVGVLIIEERFSIAQEHALSQLIQGELRAIFNSISALEGSSPQTKAMLFCTREGDHHDIGLMLAAILCRSQGIRCQYLGPNLPAESLLSGIKTLKPSAVVLGLSYLSEEERVSPQQYVATINQDAPVDCELWIGGSAASMIKRPRSKRTVWIFESLKDLELKLARTLSKSR